MTDNSSSTESGTTTTGTDQTQTTETSTTKPSTESTTSTTTGETQDSKTTTTLINEPDTSKPEARVAQEKYEDFKLPDGVKLNDEQLTKATELFKGLSLDQAGAQSLIDFHTAELARVAKATEDASDASFRDTVEGWGTALKADPEIGTKLATVKQNLGRAYDVLINAVPEKAAETRALVNEFKTTLDLTGIGNHPAFVKVFNRLAQMVIEPGHVPGKNPAPAPGADTATHPPLTPQPAVAPTSKPTRASLTSSTGAASPNDWIAPNVTSRCEGQS